MYLSSFKDLGGSRIIQASRIFTQANKDQQRESSHAVYSINKDYLNEFMETDIIGEPRSKSISKIKISYTINFNKLSRKGLVKTTDFISSGMSWPGLWSMQTWTVKI